MIMDIETIIETNTSMRTQELLPPPNTSLASPASPPRHSLASTATSWDGWMLDGCMLARLDICWHGWMLDGGMLDGWLLDSWLLDGWMLDG